MKKIKSRANNSLQDVNKREFASASRHLTGRSARRMVASLIMHEAEQRQR